jgi:DNA modification methylase
LKNRFNRLTSKEWLPFQKSWFRYERTELLYSEHLRFFCKAEKSDESVFYFGNDPKICRAAGTDNDINVLSGEIPADARLQYAIIDLRKKIEENPCSEALLQLKEEIVLLCRNIYPVLEEKRFVSIFVPNLTENGIYHPFAWNLAQEIAAIFSLKDEKIACCESRYKPSGTKTFLPDKSLFYVLNFRKDEYSDSRTNPGIPDIVLRKQEQRTELKFSGQIDSWFILRPQPRKKDEILHPAKYPEALVEMFIHHFSNEGANILDPMSGTGSTQVGALRTGRNGFGTELSPFFADIAENRCKNIIQPTQPSLFGNTNSGNYRIINKDARQISKSDFPEIDYVLTSPPYWDMLNMKGAENQAKRIEKGLQTNYSDDQSDLGNIADYLEFIHELKDIYFNISELIRPGGYMTIVVKNIKKKGRNYPFAWDLAALLSEKLILLPEVFWCQDDINLAPYGYGNTFVSNTFHQYCLNFQKSV